MTNLSQWFDLAEQKPWEVGVYEVTNGHYSGIVYSVWNGACWSFTCRSIESAILNSDTKSRDNIIKWRGLSTNPEVKKKTSGNRKVTRYVVTEHAYAVGVYEVEKNARKHAERIECGHVQTIRFLTPE